MAHDVFLSYAHQDKAIADQVCEHLEGQGIDCWIAPRNIIEGETFGAAITQAIETCRIVILLFSTAANSSKQVVRELKLADDAGKTVIPVRLANIKASGDFAYFLGAAHWLDAVGGPAKAHLERLTYAARNYLAPSAQPPSSKPAQISLPAGTVRTNPIDAQRYVWVPPGTFWMGASPDDTDASEGEKPRHQVTLTKGFWLGETVVTLGAYRRFAAAKNNGKMPPTPPFSQTDEDPIVNVDWQGAQDYCERSGGRLPTEAEWEYAARAGTTGPRYGDVDDIAWYNANSGDRTRPVRTRQANPLGLYDVLGNVWEWTADWYGPYSDRPATDPLGAAKGDRRVVRGGGWRYEARDLRSSGRGRGVPGNGSSSKGFRCAREVLP